MKKQALGLLEIHSWTATMAALDQMGKAADIAVLQIEINDLCGTCVKITGSIAGVHAALDAGQAMAEEMRVLCVTRTIPAPDIRVRAAYEAQPEFSPLIEQSLVYFSNPKSKELDMSSETIFAIGMIETQGMTAVIEAIDTACKAASVEVIGREKLGGGYITVLIKGDVGAVTAAIEAGKSKVDGLGKLIAAHVIARPCAATLSFLPKP